LLVEEETADGYHTNKNNGSNDFQEQEQTFLSKTKSRDTLRVKFREETFHRLLRELGKIFGFPASFRLFLVRFL